MKMQINSLEELNSVAETILSHHKEARVFALKGEMGAGKTTFVKALCQVLSSESLVSSPTFTIINEYISKQNSPIFHFDFYRLERVEEAHQIGVEDYFYSGHYCFIEWPQILFPIMPEGTVYVNITVDEMNNTRTIEF